MENKGYLHSNRHNLYDLKIYMPPSDVLVMKAKTKEKLRIEDPEGNVIKVFGDGNGNGRYEITDKNNSKKPHRQKQAHQKGTVKATA